MLAKISANWYNACRWLSDIGDRGDGVAGLSRAAIRSFAAAAAASAGVAPGIFTCSGSQVSVSAIRSAEVSFIHTL